MARFLSKFVRETKGAAMVEFAASAGLLLFLTMGAVDFSLAFYQWNSASKAVQLGARLAAVSDPICSDLSNEDGTQNGDPPGFFPPPSYSWVYSGGSCSGGPVSNAAINNLIFGRGSNACQDGGSFPGMCDIFPQITAQNVIVRYTSTGLGYVGRPLGPVPTITVEVTGLTFNFMLLNGVLGLGPINMPRMHTTVTGEDLSTSGP